MTSFQLFYQTMLCVLVVLLLLESTQGFSHKKLSKKTREKKKLSKARPILASIGANCKLKCSIHSKNAVVKWYYNGKILNETLHQSKYSFIRRKNKEILKIAMVTLKDSGTYSCEPHPGKSVSWRILVKKGKRGRCRRDSEKPNDPCPKRPRTGWLTNCYMSPLNFENCGSLAGDPENIAVRSFFSERKGKPIIEIEWNEPKIGNRDLWGYEVSLFGLQGDNNNFRCFQINRKNLTWWWFSEDVQYKSTYLVKLRSLPSTTYHSREVYIKEKCQFDELKHEPICCKLFTINATILDKEGKIELSWGVRCFDRNVTLRRFEIVYHNLQILGEDCYGDVHIDFEQNTKIFNYTIHLKKGCQRFNYSIKVYGLDSNNVSTDSGINLIADFPEKKIQVPPESVSKNYEPINKIIVSIVGVLFGTALVGLFFVYKCYFSKVVVKLPNYAYRQSNDGSNDGSLLERSDYPKRIFLMHARCCEKCKWVVHCLGELLKATNVIDPVCDLWCEQDIASNPIRWYGEQVSHSDCVIVLASNKMKSNYDGGRNVANGVNDLLPIQAQLNFVSGEITQNADNPKFITAYFAYNGERSDVPQFLNSRLPYKLTKDLDRLIFHVLNIEQIQPHRTRPIAILGGTTEFNSKKSDLLNAVCDAKDHHLNQDMNNSLA